jgi:hypothetical protein
MKKPAVLLPAIKKRDGTVVKAKSILQSHQDIGVSGQHGFILSNGKFASRAEAAKDAESIGEVPKSAGKKLHSHELREALGIKNKK